MDEHITGQTPETVIKLTTPAEMIKVRTPEKYEEINDTVFLLNPTDQIISSATPKAFENFVNSMASKGLDGLNLPANL